MGVARQFLVDNEWITKLMEGRENEIRPCIHCHNACLTMVHYNGVANVCDMADSMHMSRCALNPMTMDGGKYDIKPAKKCKKVAIVGGGIGGMETARIATLRGHRVTIYEKSDKLGGVYNQAANFDFKEPDKKLLEWYKNQITRLNIEVKLNTEVKDIKNLDADEVVIATGSSARKLNMANGDKCIDALTYLSSKKEKIGKTVLVVGGGLTGCEIAYDLHRMGRTPIIVEAKNDLMAVKGLSLANSSYLRDYFKLNKVPVYLESTLKEIGEKEVIIATKDGDVRVNVDDIILAIGYNPNPIAKKSAHVHIVGDAEKVGNLRTVIWKAWEVAEKI